MDFVSSLISKSSLFALRLSSKLDSLSSDLSPKRCLTACSLLSCGTGFRPGRFLEISEPDRVSIGRGFSYGQYVRLHAWPKYCGHVLSEGPEPLIIIGDNVFINSNSYITAAKCISIGDNCLIGSNVLISDNGHGATVFDTIPRRFQPLSIKGGVSIGSNVWICNNVVITSGVVVGSNSIIAANSVVTSDVLAGSLVGGVPARLIRLLSRP